MRLPHPQLESCLFAVDSAAELIDALGGACDHDEEAEILRLAELGIPPVTSSDALAVMFGYNPGLIWSLLHRTNKHYRQFRIPKGPGSRNIHAPRVALKAIQTWLSFHYQRTWEPSNNVFGFVPGRSHIQAARQHLRAAWVYSVDIEDFFPSISKDRVYDALRRLGYQSEQSIHVVSSICCLRDRLVQGAPTSPVLSNIVLDSVDKHLASLAAANDVVFTRYADDIVFSGRGAAPAGLQEDIKDAVVRDGWTLSSRKEYFAALPKRLKVHGLLVHGTQLRLTKGYRNRIRAYRHLTDANKVRAEDRAMIHGHLRYAAQVDSDH